MPARTWRVVVVGTSGDRPYFETFDRAVRAGWSDVAVTLPADGEETAPLAVFGEVGGSVAAVTARVQDVLDDTGAGFITAILVQSLAGGCVPCRPVGHG